MLKNLLITLSFILFATSVQANGFIKMSDGRKSKNFNITYVRFTVAAGDQDLVVSISGRKGKHTTAHCSINFKPSDASVALNFYNTLFSVYRSKRTHIQCSGRGSREWTKYLDYDNGFGKNQFFQITTD